MSSRLNNNIRGTNVNFTDAFKITGANVNQFTGLKDLLKIYADTMSATSGIDGLKKSLESLKASTLSAGEQAARSSEAIKTLKTLIKGEGAQSFIDEIEQDLQSGNIDSAIQKLTDKFAHFDTVSDAQRQAILRLGNSLGIDLSPVLAEIAGRSSTLGDSLTRLGNLMGDLSAKTTQLGRDLASIGKEKLAVFANGVLKAGQYALTALGAF
jgi:hypothetical protein